MGRFKSLKKKEGGGLVSLGKLLEMEPSWSEVQRQDCINTGEEEEEIFLKFPYFNHFKIFIFCPVLKVGAASYD